jgi:ribosomal protein S18 acetylase RimI-like enzyme
MTLASGYRIRPAALSDESFLWEMLYQSLYVEEGHEPFAPEIVNEPQLARYVAGWGRAGDMGFVAVEMKHETPVGAVWSRLPGDEDKGFACVDDETPELAVAVLPEYRGQGIGTALLKRHLEEAKGLYRALALSVSPQNPAKRLYERLGFKVVSVGDDGHPVMKRELRAEV